jgi:hypothetical protein
MANSGDRATSGRRFHGTAFFRRPEFGFDKKIFAGACVLMVINQRIDGLISELWYYQIRSLMKACRMVLTLECLVCGPSGWVQSQLPTLPQYLLDGW